MWTDILQIITAGMMLVATGIYVALTRRLAIVAEGMASPRVSLWLERDGEFTDGLVLVIRSCGASIAENVRFRFNPDPPYRGTRTKLSEIKLFTKALALAPNREIRVLLADEPTLYDGTRDRVIVATVSYHSTSGRSFEDHVSLTIGPLDEVTVPQSAIVSGVASSLKMIRVALEKRNELLAAQGRYGSKGRISSEVLENEE